ncbi:hypothetical protein AX774_g5542 [Zancudomyces culisetae]|uniref:Uncharacterized protein n=1 Tax=Zancudomyces culisetae TaxID=1213189 RepID=A0A1R1PJ18_ZANCU|nr:hypothetical protein AX774_g5542 [Zancudomyces culisetae]|eukprot:OMH81005.1 hypothetical protein AX774_g5542 [Zancudomyces culisetae]
MFSPNQNTFVWIRDTYSRVKKTIVDIFYGEKDSIILINQEPEAEYYHGHDKEAYNYEETQLLDQTGHIAVSNVPVLHKFFVTIDFICIFVFWGLHSGVMNEGNKIIQ